MFAVPAQAGSISITGTPVPDVVIFTEEPANFLRVTSPLGFDGTATYTPTNPIGQSDDGLVQFGSMDFFTGPASAGVFTPLPLPPPTQTFNYESTTDSDQLTSLITWTELDSNAPFGEPELVGTAAISSISGDLDFVTDFQFGVNIRAKFPVGCDLVSLSMGVCMTTFESVVFEGADASSGGPPPPPCCTPPLIETPEPMTSFTGLGIGLFGLWGAYQLTRRDCRRLMS
jgi:hypothetical protein